MSDKSPEIENYLSYADERRVTISVLEEFGGGEEPYEVYHASVPGDAPLGRDDITKSFLEHLYGKDGYAIDQHLSIYECGASGMLQDISVEVIGGVATPFVLYALHRLRTWISSSPHVQEPSSIEDCLRSLTDLIQCRYRSSGHVQLTSHEATTDLVSAVFRDERGTTYSCSIERRTGISTIKTRRKTL